VRARSAPSAISHSPTVTEGDDPMTVVSSRNGLRPL